MSGIRPYEHHVQYYETDMMGITHHANYIHWMEEARIDFLQQLGFSYQAMEADGILSPVTKLSCEYKHTSTFGDVIRIDLSVASFNGIILRLRYRMCNAKDEEVCRAESEHVFVNRDNQILRLKRERPDLYAAIRGAMEEGGPERP